MRSRSARKTPNVEIIWASTREVFNVVEADEMGCHIITAPADVLKKLPALGTKTGGGTLARRGQGVPRRCAGGRADARPGGRAARIGAGRRDKQRRSPDADSGSVTL